MIRYYALTGVVLFPVGVVGIIYVFILPFYWLGMKLFFCRAASPL